MLKAGLYSHEIVRLRNDSKEEGFNAEEWANQTSTQLEVVERFLSDFDSHDNRGPETGPPPPESEISKKKKDRPRPKSAT